MYRRHGQKLVLVFLACDLAVTASTWIAAYLFRFSYIPAPRGVPAIGDVTAGLPLVLLLAAGAYHVCGLYEIHRLRQLPREMTVACKASGLLFVLAITATFYARDAYVSRLALSLFLVLNTLALTAMRRVVWAGLKVLRRRGLNYGRAVIVGTGRSGRLAAQRIQDNRWTGLEAVGYVDHAGKCEPADLPRLGDLDELSDVVRRHDIDHVFIALPLSRYGELPQVYRALDDLLVDVQLVPDISNLAGMRVRMLEIDDVAFLSLRENPHAGWHRIAKRSMDLAVGGLSLLAVSPVMLFLALAIKLTSRGAVFYRQTRTSLGGQTFEMFKFRTMRPDAERDSGPVWAAKDDDRCTWLGRLMRRYSLDELPQLFNVLLGDMSLVGPRPERNVFVSQFGEKIPSYAQRHQVKSGMTGWAQVNGWRGNTSWRRRLEFDLYYVTNWSIWLDVKILGLTLWCAWRDKHAY